MPSAFQPPRSQPNRPRRAVRARWSLPLAPLFLSLWVALPLGLTADLASAGYPLTIIELRHRLPEDLIPVLAPLAGPDGVVTGANASLFVRASPSRLADIRAALARLDSPARNLLVEVRRTAAGERSRGSLGVTVNEPIGSDGRIRVGPGRQTGINASTGRHTHNRDLLQQVRVLDGGEAFIRTGTERPAAYRDLDRDAGGGRARYGVGYVSADNGFYVRPRVNGNRVVVDLSSRAADFGPGGDIHTGAVDTRVSGRLGEWIAFGGNLDSAAQQNSGLGYRGNAAGRSTGDLELRVRAID